MLFCITRSEQKILNLNFVHGIGSQNFPVGDKEGAAEVDARALSCVPAVLGSQRL